MTVKTRDAKDGELIKLAAGEYALREGEESNHLFYVQIGTLAVLQYRGNGSEQQIGTIYKGEVVGEMSFLDKAPRSASVKAMTDCELLMIRREKFEKDLLKLPIWFQALINTSLDRLRKANKRVKI